MYSLWLVTEHSTAIAKAQAILVIIYVSPKIIAVKFLSPYAFETHLGTEFLVKTFVVSVARLIVHCLSSFALAHSFLSLIPYTLAGGHSMANVYSLNYVKGWDQETEENTDTK